MYKFNENSMQKLSTCHPDLQRLLQRVIQFSNFTILDSYRDEQRQNEAFATGKSRLRFPQSKHNSLPSRAVDIAPFPLDWSDAKRFCYLAGLMIATAKEMQIALRWGGDWNCNGEISDNKFNDLVHFELL